MTIVSPPPLPDAPSPELPPPPLDPPPRDPPFLLPLDLGDCLPRRAAGGVRLEARLLVLPGERLVDLPPEDAEMPLGSEGRAGRVTNLIVTL